MPKDALYYNGTPDKPLYELNADQLAVSVSYLKSGKSYTIFARVKTPGFESSKKILNNVTLSESKDIGANVSERIASGESNVRDVADSCFIELAAPIGKVPAIEAQKHWLDSHPDVKELIGLRAVINASLTTPEKAEDIFADEGDEQEIDIGA